MIKENSLERDAVDLSSTDISSLFKQMFFPTLLGMLSIVAITIADGVFVGQGIGSNALASVNIIAPLFMITTGVSLLFGVGASVIASIHLSQNKTKAANIIITQALIAALFVISIMGVSIMIWGTQSAYLLGASDMLLDGVLEYMYWIVPAFFFSVITGVGLFVIRLDGSPTYAMMCNVVPAVINIVLDYVFVFPLGLGLMGAALATGTAIASGAVMVIIYFVKYKNTLRIYKLKISMKSLRLTIRNIGYMVKVGSSSMLGEVAIASMMLIGNYMFMKYLQEDGVAAYSVMCYCFPIIFMVSNAIAHSTQPILSYNYGIGRWELVRRALRLSMSVALFLGLFLCGVMFVFCPYIVGMFLAPDTVAYAIAVDGIPYFTLGFVFFALNISWIGYYQSVEQNKKATFFMIMRGIVLMAFFFITLPMALGDKGLWLAIPFTEFVVFVMLVASYFWRKSRR